MLSWKKGRQSARALTQNIHSRLSASATPTSSLISLSCNSALDFFLLFGRSQFSAAAQVIQCYNTPPPHPHLTPAKKPFRVSTSSPRLCYHVALGNLLGPISCHQNVSAFSEHEGKETGCGVGGRGGAGGGGERSPSYHFYLLAE